MFDIGFPELLLVAVVALLVLGPERLPQALRTLGLWLGRARRSFNSMKHEIEREIGMDEVRRQLHNETVMEELRRIERDVRGTIDAPAEQPSTAIAEIPAESVPETDAAARTRDSSHEIPVDATAEQPSKAGATQHG